MDIWYYERSYTEMEPYLTQHRSCMMLWEIVHRNGAMLILTQVIYDTMRDRIHNMEPCLPQHRSYMMLWEIVHRNRAMLTPTQVIYIWYYERSYTEMEPCLPRQRSYMILWEIVHINRDMHLPTQVIYNTMRYRAQKSSHVPPHRSYKLWYY